MWVRVTPAGHERSFDWAHGDVSSQCDLHTGGRSLRPDVPRAQGRAFFESIAPHVGALDGRVAEVVHGYNAGDAEATFAALDLAAAAGDALVGLIRTLTSGSLAQAVAPLRSMVDHLLAAGTTWRAARSNVERVAGPVDLSKSVRDLPIPAGAGRSAGWEAVLWEEVQRADRVWVAVADELAAVGVSGPID